MQWTPRAVGCVGPASVHLQWAHTPGVAITPSEGDSDVSLRTCKDKLLPGKVIPLTRPRRVMSTELRLLLTDTGLAFCRLDNRGTRRPCVGACAWGRRRVGRACPSPARTLLRCARLALLGGETTVKGGGGSRPSSRPLQERAWAGAELGSLVSARRVTFPKGQDRALGQDPCVQQALAAAP